MSGVAKKRPHLTSKGWLSAHGQYNPIGTPDLDLVPEERIDLSALSRVVAGGDDSEPTVLPDLVVDHHAKAYHTLRSEIRRSTRAIPACMAGQDLQEVLANPNMHTQSIPTLPDIGGGRNRKVPPVFKAKGSGDRSPRQAAPRKSRRQKRKEEKAARAAQEARCSRRS
eukprot:SAG31_NODE_6364_length_2042_cov_4.664643_1_plen_168_part_00